MASGGFPGWHLLVVFTLGTVLMRSAGCCINDVADREFDRHVKRTAGRPVTSGAVSVREALGVGALLALVAFGLVLTTNALTVQYSFAALAVTLAYPYAKRWVSMPQAVLGVAFSFGIPMAFAAVRSEVPAPAWWLLVGNLFWVLAYDTEYAMVDRDDDLRIGIQTSAITLGRFDVAAVMAARGHQESAAELIPQFTCPVPGGMQRAHERVFQVVLLHRRDGGIGRAALGGHALAQHLGRIV
jgi:4-hydroxybenzoate polyprenyltransferase